MWQELDSSIDSSLPDEGRVETRARFLADESFPPRAVELLRSAGAQVWTAADNGLAGQPDDAHAAFAADRQLSLLTCHPGVLDPHRASPYQGLAVFVFHFGSGSLNDMRRALRCLAPVLGSPRFDASARVEATGNGWTEHGYGTRYRLWRGKVQAWREESCVEAG
jgi:hypothetical protein